MLVVFGAGDKRVFIKAKVAILYLITRGMLRRSINGEKDPMQVLSKWRRR